MVKAALYAVQVFYSFFIMCVLRWSNLLCLVDEADQTIRLLFMTYNGWIMLAVAVGAFGGYLAFGSDSSATKSVACH
jgi:solute carrier family 31 (copper transporter), member 1